MAQQGQQQQQSVGTGLVRTIIEHGFEGAGRSGGGRRETAGFVAGLSAGFHPASMLSKALSYIISIVLKDTCLSTS